MGRILINRADSPKPVLRRSPIAISTSKTSWSQSFTNHRHLQQETSYRKQESVRWRVSEWTHRFRNEDCEIQYWHKPPQLRSSQMLRFWWPRLLEASWPGIQCKV
jgi:hypothetical protein